MKQFDKTQQTGREVEGIARAVEVMQADACLSVATATTQVPPKPGFSFVDSTCY